MLLLFYKGTSFPIIWEESKLSELQNIALEMIKKGLKSGESLKDQIEIYKKQLERIEKLLCKYCNMNPYGLEKLEQILQKDRHELHSIWSLNILALLKLKAIPNDNNYGILIQN
jgi:hypothetical protein